LENEPSKPFIQHNLQHGCTFIYTSTNYILMLENEFDATKILNITAFKDLLSNFDGQWLVGYRNKFHIFLVAKKVSYIS
jgi:hypothetical protein